MKKKTISHLSFIFSSAHALYTPGAVPILVHKTQGYNDYVSKSFCDRSIPVQ